MDPMCFQASIHDLFIYFRRHSLDSALQRVERELPRLDLLIHREVMRLRARHHLSLDEFRGLYISDEHVDQLLRNSAQPFDVDAVTAQAEDIRRRHEKDIGSFSEWRRIVAEFSLTAVEEDILFLALAPELDSKYETLYGYLNNDVTRKFGTRDLVRRLLSEHGPGAVDHALAAGSALSRSGLLVGLPATHGFQASVVLSGFILARNASPVPPLRRVQIEGGDGRTASNLQSEKKAPTAALLRSGAVVVLNGNRGCGRLETAAAICQQAGMGLLLIDANDAKVGAESNAFLAGSIRLQARLEGAALYIENGEQFFDAEYRPHNAVANFLSGLDNVPLCYACTPRINWREVIGHRRAVELTFPTLPYANRFEQWKQATKNLAVDAPEEAIHELAQQFVFTAGEIASAAHHAKDCLSMERRPVREALFAAARTQSASSLGKLASKISASYRWKDLVLPRTTAAQVREVAAAIRNRSIVYEEWRLPSGFQSGGLNVLFSGASGTGKTMSACIIAAESGLDLYRIDLATVVSKYIGETEKNLDRIFTAAHSSNAILFFDEADALFGRRSEVKDAHDRYANVEVAYLLQKLEEHDGVVILASNLPRNMDKAFTRRIQFQVEFPIPGDEDRERLWRGMFPAQVPVAPDVDFAFLSRQFQLTGGQIRTISVDAAFLAAADGRRVTMPLIIKSLARYLVRQGQMPTAHEFREYFSLASGTAV